MEQLNEVFSVLQEVWEQGVYGLNLGQWLAALVIAAVAWLGRGMLSRGLVGFLRLWVHGTKTELDDKLFEAFQGPFTLLPLIIGAALIGLVLNLNDHAQQVVDQTMQSLFVALLFWGFHNSIGMFTGTLRKLEKLLNPLLVDWLLRALKIILIFLGAAITLELWGIEVAPLLAGLGLFGVAVALGAQDMFKNFFAGLLIISEKRFAKGDWIKAPSVEGTVENIGFRSTQIRQFDKALVYVPNVQLADAAVVNFSEMTHRRIYWHIGVEYRTTSEQLRQIVNNINDYIMLNDKFAKPDEVSTFVRIDRFAASSIDIMLYCFTKTTDWGEWLQIKEELALKIKEIVEQAGTGFAFPSRTVYVEPTTTDAEAFVLPAAE